jgi:RNA polymerase sigma-70 factor (ECF subfamily)
MSHAYEGCPVSGGPFLRCGGKGTYDDSRATFLCFVLSHSKKQSGGNTMKIKYQFMQETIEIEIDEAWGNVLINLDRDEYNNEHKETRRHVSFDSMDYEGNIFTADNDVTAELIRSLDNKALHAAIKSLLPHQKELVRRVYFNGESLASIAREEGVSKVALTNRMKKIHEKLKKVLI